MRSPRRGGRKEENGGMINHPTLCVLAREIYHGGLRRRHKINSKADPFQGLLCSFLTLLRVRLLFSGLPSLPKKTQATCTGSVLIFILRPKASSMKKLLLLSLVFISSLS